ncbi:MAG: PQQ-binding-like beta-propeller repeat protein [Phycisphaerae bacterium]
MIKLMPAMLILAAVVAAPAQAQESFDILTSTYIGGAGEDDAVRGSAIQSDGTVVIAANVGAGFRVADFRATGPVGVILRLSPDGREVLSARAVGRIVGDLALDGKDNIVVAAGTDGVVKLDPRAREVLWHRELSTRCHRVDVGADGTVAVLAEDKDIGKAEGKDARVGVLSADGRPLGDWKGHRQTFDVCVDSASGTVITIGWRQANCFDGTRVYPVQIAYMRGRDYSGNVRWTNYDWSTDRDADDFLNKPTNNMADTRGYRCSIGADGKLYAAFEAAGGNHIFRYDPHEVTRQVGVVGGDKYHEFYNTRSEHKTVFGRYNPRTGDVELVQQFCGRLGSGRGNAVRVKNGEITADAAGRVYLTGSSAYGLPLSYNPPGTGDYTGGAFVLVMSPDLKQRLLCTRPLGGKGQMLTVSPGTVEGKTRLVIGGSGMEVIRTENGETLQMRTVEPLQEEPAGAKDGFMAVMELK